MDKKELAKSLKKAVEVMKCSDGCYEIPLGGQLSVFVGWSGGYDEDDDTCIHSTDDERYCLNAGIKVNTSDSMKTDYEYINSPYYDSGDVWSTDCTIKPNEDYDNLADYLFKEYEAMKALILDEDGRIDNCRCPEDYCSGLVD